LGNAAVNYLKKIEIQQNYIVKIVTKAPFFKTKVAPIYQQLNFLTLENVFKFEVLKFVFNFKRKQFLNISINTFNRLLKCTITKLDLFRVITLLAVCCLATVCLLAVTKYNKTITQRSIRHTGGKLWNEMPDEIKRSIYLSQNIFLNKVKGYLKSF